MAQGSNISSAGPLRVRPLANLRGPNILGGAAAIGASADQLGRLAGRLNLVGGDLFARGARREEEQAAREGQQAGLKAAASGVVLEQRDSGFLFGRQDDAFNRAAETAYFQGAQVRIEQQRQQLELEHEADPNGFMKAWDQVQAEGLNSAPASLRQQLALEYEQHGNGGDFRLAAQKKKRVANQAGFNVRLRADQLANLAGQAARQAGNPAAAADYLGQLWNEDPKRPGAINEAVKAGWLSDGEAAAIVLSARDQAYSAGYLGAFERHPTPAALADFLNDPTPELGQGQKDRLAGKMEAILAHRDAQERAAHRALGQEVNAAIGLMGQGIEVQDLGALQARAAGTEFAPMLEIAGGVADEVRSIAQLPPAAQQAKIAALDKQIESVRAIGATAEDAAIAETRLAALSTARDAAASSLQRTADLVGKGMAVDRAGELGLMQVEPIDFGHLDAMSAQVAMRKRAEQASVAEAHFGVPAGSPLTGAELDGFKQLMQAGPAESAAQTAALAAMQQNWGEDRTRAVLGLVAKDAPLMAAAGGLLMDQPLVGQELIRGRAVMAENPKLVPPRTNQDLRDTVAKVYGDAFAGSPAGLAVAEDAARAVYASRQFAEGKLDGEFDDTAFKQALKDVVGGDVLEWGNDAGGPFWGDETSKVFPPRVGMGEDQFGDLMEGLTDEDLALSGGGPVDANGNPVSAAALRRTARLQNYGRGQYLVTIGGFRVLSEAGGPYILDLEAVLRAREGRR